MDALTRYLRETLRCVRATLVSPRATASDIFYAIHHAAFLPGCPTCPEAVTQCSFPFVCTTVATTDVFPNRTSIRAEMSALPSNNGPVHQPHVLGFNFLTTLCSETSSYHNNNAELTADELHRLVCRLVFSRVVEAHLALAPSPFENKQRWYNASKAGLCTSMEDALGLAQELLKKSFAQQAPQHGRHASAGLASGAIAIAAAVLLRAIHVEHVISQLRGTDHYLSQTLKPLEVTGRHAVQLFKVCSAARSIDMLAVHCPLFVVIVAAAMEKLPGARQIEKDRREMQFARNHPAMKAAEDAKLLLVQQQQQLESSSSPALRSSSGMHAQTLSLLDDNVNSNPASASSGSAAVPEQIVEWTNHMLRYAGAPLELRSAGGAFGADGGGGSDDGGFVAGQQGQPFGMGTIPPGILHHPVDGDASMSTTVPVDVFAKIFIAARLATEHLGRTSGDAAKTTWSNAATAFSSFRGGDGGGSGENDEHDASDDGAGCAAPFAEIAAISRLRMGDAPSGGSATLRALGCTVLQDVCLALRCGHPLAFDAAVADASQELAARGLLASVMTLRTHAVMMLVKKYLAHKSECLEAKRLDVEDFFARYRSQLPASLLDTEMQLIVPLILGQRLKARLEHATLAMAGDPLAFDS